MVKAVDADIHRKQTQGQGLPHSQQNDRGEPSGMPEVNSVTPTPQFENDHKAGKKKSKKLNPDSRTKQGQDVFYKTEIGLKTHATSNNDYHMFSNFHNQV